MAIAPTKLKPSFEMWIHSGYFRPKYSSLYKNCIHAMKRSVDKIVDIETANRLKTHFGFIEKPIIESFEVSNDIINDLRTLRSGLDDLDLKDESVVHSIVADIVGEKNQTSIETEWKSCKRECKTALDMYLRYTHFKGEHSKLCGQSCYIREKYREKIDKKVGEMPDSILKTIELSYDPNSLIVGDDNDIKQAIRSALKGLKVNDNNRIKKVSIISDLITISLEQIS